MRFEQNYIDYTFVIIISGGACLPLMFQRTCSKCDQKRAANREMKPSRGSQPSIPGLNSLVGLKTVNL